jgi:MFS family permease
VFTRFARIASFHRVRGRASHPKKATATTSAGLVTVQLVMAPIALLVGRKADAWGRKPLFLAGFAILPIRAVLYIFFKTFPLYSPHHNKDEDNDEDRS